MRMLSKVAEELRESVHKETGLTCSAGVAPNRLLAKVFTLYIKGFCLALYSPFILFMHLSCVKTALLLMN